MPQKPNKILAVVNDLFFVVKINDSAKRAGLSCDFVKTEAELISRCTAETPLMIILDLNATTVNPVSVIQSLKADETLRRISVIGFVSHVQGELKQQAQDAGANMVMARSAFSANLPQILKRHTGSM